MVRYAGYMLISQLPSVRYLSPLPAQNLLDTSAGLDAPHSRRIPVKLKLMLVTLPSCRTVPVPCLTGAHGIMNG